MGKENQKASRLFRLLTAFGFIAIFTGSLVQPSIANAAKSDALTQPAVVYPSITSISPSSAIVGGAAFTLIVTGTNFISTSKVRWNGVDQTTTVYSDKVLSAAITAADFAIVGTYPVMVINYIMPFLKPTSNVVDFYVNNPVPILTSLSPSTAIAGGAAFTLTVAGTHFIIGSVVRWNGSDRTTTYVSATQLNAVITAADLTTTGIYHITVFNPAPGGGGSNYLNFTVINPVPSITAISPSSAIAGGAAFTLTVTGTGFISSSVVNWNWHYCPTTYVSATQLTATINAANITTTGTYNITVFNLAPGGGNSNAANFTVNNPVPTLTDLNPSSATAGDAAFTLTVTGTGFISNSVVIWNNNDRPTTYISTTQLSAAITAGDIALPVNPQVKVYNPPPGGGTSNAMNFTVIKPVPTLTDLYPPSATTGGTDFALTVNGTNFNSNSVVRWNGDDRTTTYISPNRLTAAITAADIATPGTYPITVYNPAPGEATSNAVDFYVNNPVPTLNNLSPSSVTAGDAAFTLTVTGTGFVRNSVVRWGGSARTTTYVSATQLSVAITASDIATAGFYPVTVFNPAPGGGTSNAAYCLVFAPNPVPSLTTLSPSQATAGGAAFTLTVSGTGFIYESVIRWNGSDRTTSYISTTQLTATITAADIAVDGNYPVTVFNPATGGGTSNAGIFEVISKVFLPLVSR